MRVRPAGVDELPELQEVEEACFQEERYSPEILEAMLREEGFETTLAVEDEDVLGSATVNYRPDMVAAQLVSIAVLPWHRGKGVAKALLLDAERRVRRRGAKKMVLQVGVLNVAALNLYLRHGYVLEGMIGDYYGPGKDAYFMDKVL